MNGFHLNKPVFETDYKQVFKETEDFYTYIKENTEHEVVPRYYVRSGFFATQHIYKDGLLMNLVWELTGIDFKKVHDEIGGINNLTNIVSLRNNQWVRLIHANVWEYSQARDLPEVSTSEIHKYKRHSLEYQVHYPSKIPDFIFDILVSDISNCIKFDEYIQKQESK